MFYQKTVLTVVSEKSHRLNIACKKVENFQWIEIASLHFFNLKLDSKKFQPFFIYE